MPYYKGKYFDINQMIEIQIGNKEKLNVSKYAHPKFNWRQMQQIRWGLFDKLNVNKYADHKLDWTQMEELRLNMIKACKQKALYVEKVSKDLTRDQKEIIVTENVIEMV